MQAPVCIHMKHQKICCIALSVLILGAFSVPVFAENNSISKTEIFYSEDPDEKYLFPDEIEQDGNRYLIGDISYRILSEEPEIQTSHQTE